MNEKQERNYGIDLLKIISMYMVVLLHVLGCGGILENCEKVSCNYYVAYSLEISAFGAVDIFAMITGYLMVEKKVNGFKIIPLWLTVFFYSTLIALSFYFVPFLSSIHEPSKISIIKSFFPVISGQYWYFTAYFGMFFFIPYINMFVNSIEKRTHRNLCIVIIIVFSLLPIMNLGDIKSFGLLHGCSATWLTCSYVIGAYLKKYPLNITPIKSLMIYFASIFLIWFIKYFSRFMFVVFFQKDKDTNLFIDFTSILVIVSAIALVSFFEKLNIKNMLCKKMLTFASALSFSVYLIHTNHIIYGYIIKDHFISMVSTNPFRLFVGVILNSLLIFIACLSIDIVRCALFKLLRVRRYPNFFALKCMLFNDKINQKIRGKNDNQ